MKPALLLAVAICGVLLPFSVAAQDTNGLMWGAAAPVSTAQRTIAIEPNTRWVNVVRGETIRFVAGNAEFGWRFDGQGASFDLRQVAPAGALTRAVPVYVSRGPTNRT